MVGWQIFAPALGPVGGTIGACMGAFVGGSMGFFGIKKPLQMMGWSDAKQRTRLSSHELRAAYWDKSSIDHELLEELDSRGEDLLEEAERLLDTLSPSAETTTLATTSDRKPYLNVVVSLLQFFPELTSHCRRLHKRGGWQISDAERQHIQCVLQQSKQLREVRPDIPYGQPDALMPLLDVMAEQDVIPALGYGWQATLRSSLRRCPPQQHIQAQLHDRLLRTWQESPATRPFVLGILSDAPSQQMLRSLRTLLRTECKGTTPRDREALQDAIQEMETALVRRARGSLSLLPPDDSLHEESIEGGVSLHSHFEMSQQNAP